MFWLSGVHQDYPQSRQRVTMSLVTGTLRSPTNYTEQGCGRIWCSLVYLNFTLAAQRMVVCEHWLSLVLLDLQEVTERTRVSEPLAVTATSRSFSGQRVSAKGPHASLCWCYTGSQILPLSSPSYDPWSWLGVIISASFSCIALNFNISKTRTLFSGCSVILCIHNPPNSDMDYGIFSMHIGTFCICMGAHPKDFCRVC